MPTDRRDVYGRETVALLTAAEAEAFDRSARDRHGVPERVLMENAGRAAAQVLERLFPRGRVLAVVGSGNNGGDALVALRGLRSWGREVAYIPTGSRPPDTELAHGHALRRTAPGEAAAAIAAADVVVDGILGTGATGAPREPAASLIRAINESGRPVIALDVPSGVDPTLGAVPGAAIRAAVTVAFGWPKRGLLFQPGREHSGRIVTVEIGFPPLAADRPPGAALITPAWAAARLPVRPADAHKGSVGRLLILAGSDGMAGAAAMTGVGALRGGCGLIRIASAAVNREILQTLVPAIVFVNRDDDEALERAASDADAVLAGPGIGLDEAAHNALERVLAATPGRPTLLDADALTLLGHDDDTLRRRAAERPLTLTPHVGEMSRLTGLPSSRIREEPITAACEMAERTRCVVLLKGAPSVVVAPDQPILVNSVGSSDVASAGMGDQLAGVIGAFLAGGVETRTAAALGLFYAGRAADLAARGRSLIPGDVSGRLDRAFAEPGHRRSPLRLPFVTFDQPPRS